MWILLAICSAASLGFANIAHKRLLDNYLDGVGVLGVGSVLTRLTCAAILLAAVGWPTGASWQAIGTGLLSGISLGAGLLLLFLGLKLGEASPSFKPRKSSSSPAPRLMPDRSPVPMACHDAPVGQPTAASKMAAQVKRVRTEPTPRTPTPSR